MASKIHGIPKVTRGKVNKSKKAVKIPDIRNNNQKLRLLINLSRNKRITKQAINMILTTEEYCIENPVKGIVKEIKAIVKGIMNLTNCLLINSINIEHTIIN